MARRRETLRYARALVAINVKGVFAHRGAFWLQAAFMMLNNLMFCVIWLIFFRRFDEIDGWRLQEMLALYGMVALAYGLSVTLMGGVRELARQIAEGDLDGFLTQPKPPLIQVIGSRSFASGWGDLVSGGLLLALSGYLRIDTLPIVIVAPVCGACIFTATAIVIHSLAFWLGSMHELARQGVMYLVSFSLYPQHIFGGWLKLMLFTALPAAFIGYVPVTLLVSFRWDWGLGLIGATALYMGQAVLVFSRGLRRYESGNRIGVRA